MKILIHKDSILGFIKQNLENKEHQKQVRQILDNENSVFLYSKKFFTFIEDSIEDEDMDLYKKIRTQIGDNSQNQNVKSLPTSQTFDEEFLHIYSSVNDKVIVSISCNQPSQEIQNAIPNIAILSQQQKPNYHWLVVNLAILHPFTLSVDELDFDNCSQVDKFFDDLFSIPRKISGVTIFDDYCNTKHEKFKFLKANQIKVFYYACTDDSVGNKTKCKNLSKILSKKDLFYHKKGHAHARRIIFEGFIVNPDIDFSSLNKKDNKMWSVHIRFSETRAEQIKKDATPNYHPYNQS